jgi:hypothetical protein
MGGLTDERLASIYEGEGFGGGTSMRAKVVRELVDEIRSLRHELASVRAREPFPDSPPDAVGG